MKFISNAIEKSKIKNKVKIFDYLTNVLGTLVVASAATFLLMSLVGLLSIGTRPILDFLIIDLIALLLGIIALVLFESVYEFSTLGLNDKKEKQKAEEQNNLIEQFCTEAGKKKFLLLMNCKMVTFHHPQIKSLENIDIKSELLGNMNFYQDFLMLSESELKVKIDDLIKKRLEKLKIEQEQLLSSLNQKSEDALFESKKTLSANL